ncbi:MAG: PAS domain S-box-containing protein [Planctomycetota bacterium]|jgi:PAS domain S-box-containing protein
MADIGAGGRSVNRDSEVINLIDSRVSRLGKSTKLWIAALSLVLPLVVGLAASGLWVKTQGEGSKAHMDLILRVTIAAFACICFIVMYSRGVQRRRRGPILLSAAFLFLAVAESSAAIHSLSEASGRTEASHARGLLTLIVINFVFSVFLVWPELKNKWLETDANFRANRARMLAGILGLCLPIVFANWAPGGAMITAVKAVTGLALVFFAYVAHKHCLHYADEKEPMRLATATVAISAAVAQFMLLRASGPDMGSSVLLARLILGSALLSPIAVLIAKDALAANRSLPAQVRLIFNSIVLIVVVASTIVVTHFNQVLESLDASSELRHIFGIQQRMVVLMAAGILTAICAAMLVSTRRLRLFLNNVEDLVGATREMARGQYSGLTTKEGEDELTALTVSFNAMAERLCLQNRELSILAHVMDGTSDPVIVLSKDHHVIYTNRAFSKKTGWERRQVIGSPYDRLFSEESSRKHLATLCEQVEQGESTAGELNIDIQGGGRLASMVTISPVENGGETIYHVAVHHDLRPMKQLEAERAEFVRSLLDLHRVAKNIVESLDLAEVQRRAVVGIEVVFGAKARIWMQEDANCPSTCGHRETCRQDRHCLRLFGSSAANAICHPLKEGFLGQVMTLSTNQVCENPAEHPELFACAPDSEDMTGIRAAFPLVAAGSVMGVLELALLPGTKSSQLEVFDLLAQLLAEAIFNAKNHEHLAVQAERMGEMTENLKTAIEAEKSHAFELRKLNDKLLEADRIKNNFLSTTSHELRSPISGMMGYLQLIIDDMAEDREEEMEFIVGAHEQAQVLLDVINDVLDLAKIDSGQTQMEPESFEIDSLLSEAEATLAKEAGRKGIPLVVRRQDGTGEAYGDYLRMVQVLSIVVGNAIKFSDAGTITVSAKTRDELGFAEFRIKDEGIGLAEEDQSRILDAFVQADGGDSRRYGGSGLGLTLARDLLSMMGGTLRLESAGQGYGTTAIFTLPLSGPCVEPPYDTSFPGPTAVVVDSDPLFIEKAKDVLGTIGAQVVVAQNAADAIELIHDFKPRWVLSEAVLPHKNHPRMRSGSDLGRAIDHIEDFSVDYCIVTGHNRGITDGGSKGRWGTDILEKPVSARDIEERLGLSSLRAAFDQEPKILLVDSELDSPRRVRHALRYTPFSLEFTTHPEAAIPSLTSSTNAPEILLLDMNTPGTALYELLQVAKGIVDRGDLGILLLHSDEDDIEHTKSLFQECGHAVGSIRKSEIESSPQRFIDAIVEALPKIEHQLNT